ncbi:hypothetical protein HYU06_05470 [Candidatus Woesearchaeota archaeon]|nr:hypothetical protein [Candidatus Woesearchaeota archaeon]
MTTKLRNIKTDEDIHLTMSIYCRLKNIKMQDFANQVIKEKLENEGFQIKKKAMKGIEIKLEGY